MTILAREGFRPETRRNRCPFFIFKIQKDMIFQHKFFKTACLAALASLFFACGEHKPGDGHNHGEAAEAEHHEEAEGSLELTDEQMKAVGIALGAVEQKNLRSVVRASGQLEVPPQNQAELTTLVGGVIRQIMVLEGAAVGKGQILATLENPDFLKLQQDYVALKNGFAYTEQEAQRQRDLAQGNAGTGKVFQQAEANFRVEKAKIAALEKQLEQLGIRPDEAMAGNFATQIALRAPIGGTVSHITAKIGTFAEPARPLLEIVDNSQIHCDLLVYEKDLHKVKVGQKVNFILTNQGNRQITGAIYGVNSSFENEAKAVLVHAKIAGAQGSGLIPGMYVSGLIDVGNQSVAALPLDAVVQSEGKNFIFIVDETETHEAHDEKAEQPATAEAEAKEQEHAADEKEHHGEGTHFRKVEVATGVSELGYVEITPIGELPAGAKVVVKGAFYLLSKVSAPAEHDH